MASIPKIQRRIDLLQSADEARQAANLDLDADRRSALGQFMTPSPIAAFMAGMFELGGEHIRLLDAGAGVGSLTAAFVAEASQRSQPPKTIDATAFEIDPVMLARLRIVLAKCSRAGKEAGLDFTGHVVDRDFIGDMTRALAAAPLGFDSAPRFDAAILNPPYCKIASHSRERALLRSVGIEASNLYAGFVALAVQLLEPGGELVAITPRSFCNGPYFRAFRQLLLREMTLLRVHVFESRSRSFSEDDVLQENVIFHARKGLARGMVQLSTSHSPDAEPTTRNVPYASVVDPHDANQFIHLSVSRADERVSAAIRHLPCTLEDLGLQVSTGRVVDFRSREHLRRNPGPRTVPLIYPAHFGAGFVEWPRLGGKKPNAITDGVETAALMVASETYVLTKRFTSKEERRRIVAAVYDPTRLPKGIERVGFENHLNYFHANGAGLPKLLARGLAAFLNSSSIDRYFRQFNGHTQVNATDLRSLRYPGRETLIALGRQIGNEFPEASRLDRILCSLLLRRFDAPKPIQQRLRNSKADHAIASAALTTALSFQPA